MIHPIPAAVRPRVISPETGDAIPLADLLLEDRARPVRAVEVTGGLGAGKTTALAHLAAALPADRNVVLLDDVLPASAVEAAGDATLVFTSLHPHSAPGTVSYRLAPWGNDELVEYLLAVHPARCGSVMARLRAAPDSQLPRGLPEIWRIVLDRMAEDESLKTVSDALRQHLRQRLPTPLLRDGADQYCLAELTGRCEAAQNCHEALQRLQADVGVLKLLRHDAIRFLLAGDALAQLLEGRSGRQWLKHHLPRGLVTATAAAASSVVGQNLAVWITRWPRGCHAMAASLLHAMDPQWAPTRGARPLLSGAYLEGAAWKGVNLRGVSLEETDLSEADLTDAILDGASARKAIFRKAMLHGASLVKIQAAGADFEMAVLTAVNARWTVLCDAVLAGADLTGALLGNVDLHGANLTNARLGHTDLTYATLTEASIAGADFSRADLRWASLEGLTLSSACFAGAVFAHANLNECDLEGMELPDGDFAEASLQRAILTGSRMPRASFAGAYLLGARLADIDWEGADLRRADMGGCTFHLGTSRSGLVGSPIACEGSRTGFYGDEFDQQNFRAPEEIRKANLRGADLRDAVLAGTDFYLVDLRGAKYTREQFEHFRRCGAILFDRK